MFREFNVKFEDVEMLGGTDNLLENTEITKVIVRGDSKMSSLDSTLKNCKELDTIDGELDLNGVSDIDNLLEGTELVKSINLKNVNNENISANNSFPHIEEINICGELYNKKALQNVIASKEWTFDNISYSGTVGDNVVTKSINLTDSTEVTINDTLEQKVRDIEIMGQTYDNLINGKEEVNLLDELTIESVDGNKEFTPHIEQEVCVETIEGETYQNLIEGKGEYKLTDTFSTTWTESNNSIDNPPSVIEIPEIWGNTIQDETDLSNIQSLGDLYVDEEGEAILDEDGNEQYKLEIKSIGKNLWDGKTYHKGRKQIKEMWGSIDSSFTDNWSLKEPYGVQYDITASSMRGPTIPIEGLVGGKYINFTFKVTMPQYFPNITVHFFDKNKVYISNIYNGDNGLTGNIKSYGNYSDVDGVYLSGIIPKEATCCEIVFALSQDTDTNPYPQHIEITNLMVTVDDSVITSYRECEPQQSNKTTILMPQPLMKVANGRDKLYWDLVNKKYYIEKNIFTKVLDGSQGYTFNWRKDGYTSVRYSTSNPSKMFGNTIIANRLPVGSDCYNSPKEVIYTAWDSNIYICLKGERDFNVDWLVDNPITIYYYGDSSQTVETKILEKASLETYSPKTYISTNTEIQPSQMTVNNKKVGYIPLGLQPNKDYTLQLDSVGKDDKPITVNLGGTEAIIQPINDTSKHHNVVVRTPNELTTDKLELSGEGVVVNDVMLFEGGGNEIRQEVEYVDGIESIGELQEDGTYKIDILTRDNKTVFEEADILDTYYNKYGVYSFLVRLPSDKFNTVSHLFNEVLNINSCTNIYDYYYVDNKSKVWVNVGNKDGITSENIISILNDNLTSKKQSILLPQPLNKIGDIKDKFYWDDDKGHYCIEQNFKTKVINNVPYYNYNECIDVDNCIKFSLFNNIIEYESATAGYVRYEITSNHFVKGLNWTNIPNSIYLHNSPSYGQGKGLILIVSKDKLKEYSFDGLNELLSRQPLEIIYQSKPNPSIIDLPHLNKKYSLDTYMPTTYLQCVDTTIQPSRLLLESDIVRYKPIFLDKNKEYQVKFDCKQKGNSIKLRLGGTEKTITPTLGENTVSITTPQEIVDSRLYLSGANNKLSNVYVIADNMSTSELQEDGTYKIDISTTNQAEQFNLSFIAAKPLEEGNKLYWSSINKRYEIDRNEEIEVPTVEGDIIDLPRLYQKEDTTLVVESGNIKPSKVKVEYLDID